MNGMPWDYDPAAKVLNVVPDIKILWDYQTQQVVDGGNVSTSLFDTHWVYTFRPGDISLPWVLSRFPGDVFYKQENEVPELVRLAAMVAT